MALTMDDINKATLEALKPALDKKLDEYITCNPGGYLDIPRDPQPKWTPKSLKQLYSPPAEARKYREGYQAGYEAVKWEPTPKDVPNQVNANDTLYWLNTGTWNLQVQNPAKLAIITSIQGTEPEP